MTDITEIKQINIPPQEIINEKNFEHIILWMLSNNDSCSWSDFTQEIEEDAQLISESTLSLYLNRLKSKDFIDKPERDHYIILPKGKKRFLELSKLKKKKKSLNFPPDLIRKKRNYDHWILWMLYNNNSCRWSDFLDDPLNINQSTLSKNLNILMDSGLVRKDNKKYKITQMGRIEYSQMLKHYDLDRQSILEEESRKIEEITKRTNEFFYRYNIEDDNIKFRFLNNILKLNYLKVKNLLENIDDFNKIILFLSINHPDYYPEYIKAERFSYEYDIKKTTLDFFIDKIVEEDYYGVKFFKLFKSEDETYYFRANDRLERSLKAIVDYNITRFTYLNKLYENRDPQVFNLTIPNIIEEILKESCGTLLHEELEDALREFLPRYIQYLAYKIETIETLTTEESKLESLIWQSLSESFQGLEKMALPPSNGNETHPYNIDFTLFETLNVCYLSKLFYIQHPEFFEIKEINNSKTIKQIIDLVTEGSIQESFNYLKRNSDNLNALEYLVLSDVITTYQGNFDESINISQEIIDKYPLYYIGYLLQSITHFLMGNYDLSLKKIEDYGEYESSISLQSQKIQISLKKDDKENELPLIEEFLSKFENDYLSLILELLYKIVDPKCYTGACEEHLAKIDEDIEKGPDDERLRIFKALLLVISLNYKDASEFIDENIDFNPLHKNPLIHLSAYLILIYCHIAMGNFEKALEIAELTLVLYPNHPKAYLIKAVLVGYSLIYGNSLGNLNSDDFQTNIDKAILLDSIKSNKALYLQFKAHILSEINKYEEALETIDEAISLFPERSALLMKKAYFLMGYEKEEEAIDLLDELIIKFPSKRKEFFKWKSFIYFKIKDFEKGLKVIDKAIELDPKDKHTLNNKAILSAKLNKREEAIEAIEKLIGLYPKDGNSYDSYGEILMELGEYQEAIVKFKKAIEIEPKGWFIFETYRKMAICYQKVGTKDLAEKNFKKAEEVKKKVLPSEREKYENKS